MTPASYDVRPMPPQIGAALAERLRAVETATVGHFRLHGFMGQRLQPIQDGARIAGTAVTVRTLGIDNSALLVVMDALRPGDVLVIDRCGEDRYDAILLDVDNGPDPFVQKGNERLYAPPGIQRIKNALQPEGRVIFWSAHPDKSFARSLQGAFKHVECISAKAYPKAKRFTHTLFVADRD